MNSRSMFLIFFVIAYSARTIPLLATEAVVRDTTQVAAQSIEGKEMPVQENNENKRWWFNLPEIFVKATKGFLDPVVTVIVIALFCCVILLIISSINVYRMYRSRDRLFADCLLSKVHLVSEHHESKVTNIGGRMNHLIGKLHEGITEIKNKEKPHSQHILSRVYHLYLDCAIYCKPDDSNSSGKIHELPIMVKEHIDEILENNAPFHRTISLIIIIAPSLGFLGTILGLMIVSAQTQRHSFLPGIKVALFTTAFGLILMIVATWVDHRLETMKERLRLRLHSMINQVNLFLLLGPKYISKTDDQS